MFYTRDQRFDVTGNLEIFYELNKAKVNVKNKSEYIMDQQRTRMHPFFYSLMKLKAHKVVRTLHFAGFYHFISTFSEYGQM